jgi:DNA/RNA-binding domain of Phe-tRNA-synthetase-like protein
VTLELHELEVSEPRADFDAEVAAAEAAARAGGVGDTAPARALYRRFGVDPSRYLARVEGALTLRLGREGEWYPGIGREAVNVAGRICVADDLGACGNPSADSARTMITTDTERAAWMFFLPVAEADLRLTYELVARCGRGLVRVA